MFKNLSAGAIGIGGLSLAETIALAAKTGFAGIDFNAEKAEKAEIFNIFSALSAYSACFALQSPALKNSALT